MPTSSIESEAKRLELEVKELKLKLEEIERENVVLRQQRNHQQDMIADLGKIVDGAQRRTTDTEETERKFQSGENITPEEAMRLTVNNLRLQVEAMEDEREYFIRSISELKHKKGELEMCNEAYALKISALESIFHEINVGTSTVDMGLNKSVDESVDVTEYTLDCTHSSDTSESDNDLCDHPRTISFEEIKTDSESPRKMRFL